MFNPVATKTGKPGWGRHPGILGPFRFSKNRSRGFTLIELLIVIAIILILIAIALPNFLEAQIRARVASVRGDLRTISTALHSYFIDFQMFPNISEDEYDPSMWGLAQLTTPLQYLKELPQNAFAMGSREDQHALYFEMASTGLRPQLLALGRKKNPFNIHAFAVYSAGPDLNDNFEGERQWPFSGNSSPCFGANDMGTSTYTATNGTKSGGDLVEFGGEFRNGSWCLDGMIIQGRGADFAANAEGSFGF